MKKMLGTAVAGVMLMTTAASALDVQSVVGFNAGDSKNGRFNDISSRFYFETPKDFRVVAGLSVRTPVEASDGPLTGEMLIGAEFKAPYLGTVEVTTGLTRSNTKEDAIAPLTLRKNALYNITKDVQVGLTVNLLEISLDETNPNGKYVTVLSNIYPVLGATIKF
jgi:hypothetical protein